MDISKNVEKMKGGQVHLQNSAGNGLTFPSKEFVN